MPIFLCVQNKILQNVGLKWHYRKFFGIFGDIKTVYFSYFCFQNVLFAITADVLSFPDKNLWFSSQRGREGVVGDANGSISK